MLRLRSIEKPILPLDQDEQEEGPLLHVTFEGAAGPYTSCKFIVRMTDRDSDEELLADALDILRDAVAALHDEFQRSAQAGLRED